ncbi:hypothetical protein TNCV_658031 [Trichonephila clavipes]|uniref:Uncharacterized protein n=1 Tax=Trichonephila clavipes TaxID=2585209 RepID=A0A8X6VR57_TRICX|nr:hypothetical protein TNCV_658031 [Trichonephila clavipes]
MDVCKCIVPSLNGCTINSRKSFRAVGGRGERWEATDSPPGCSPSKLGWIRAKSFCHLHGVQGYGQRQAYI